MMKLPFLLSLTFILALAVRGQQPWSLEQCIDYALYHNLELQQQQLNIRLQERAVNQSYMNMLPSLNANGSDVNNWGKTIDRYTNEFANSRVSSINLYLQSSVTLFRGFQLLNSVKREKLEQEAQHYDLDAARDMKALEITTAYLQILYGRENLLSKQKQVQLSQMQVARTKKLVDAGALAPGDLYNIKAQYASDESQKISAENDLQLAYLKLKQLLDLPADTAFDVESPAIGLTSDSSDLPQPYLVYQYAVEKRPEVQSARLRYQRSLSDLAIARGGYYPSLSFSLGLGTGYSGANVILDGTPVFTGFTPSGSFTSAGDTVLNPTFEYHTVPKPFTDQLNENKNYSLGLHLNIPIFNNMQVRNQVKRSQIAAKQAQLQLDITKRNMRQTIEQAYVDARSAYKQYVASKLNVKALGESFKYASQKYSAGMISAYEYNDAKIKLENAQSDLLNAKYNYVFRVKVLDFYYGKPLTF